MPKNYSVNQSRIKAWRTCRLAFHFKYVQGLVLKKPRRAPYFGTIAHNMLEVNANGGNPFRVLMQVEKENGRLFAEEREVYGDMIGDLRFIMGEYFNYWRPESLVYQKMPNKKYAEFTFELPVEDGLSFKGTIDGIGLANKRLWLVEHKTYSRVYDEDTKWRNLQTSFYTRIIDMLGMKPVNGTLWDFIYSKSPTRPHINKDGTLSKREIVTLPSVAEAALKEEGLSLNSYPQLKAAAQKARETYFQRTFTPVNKGVVDVMYKDTLETAREIRDMHKKSKCRNIGFHCSQCDYELICRAELQQLDVDYVKEKHYEKELPDSKNG